MEHSDQCFHCQNGCTHEHADVPFGLTPRPAVYGSRMRHGGSVTDLSTGITIGTDEWRRIRCPGCGVEAMTPLEMVPPMCMQDDDGAYLGFCPGCMYDMTMGHKPGHGAHRRRRRRS